MRRPDYRENDLGLIKNWLRSWFFTAICWIFGALLAAAVLLMGGSEYDLDVVFGLFAGLVLLTIFNSR
jgi:hypothetical protein